MCSRVGCSTTLSDQPPFLLISGPQRPSAVSPRRSAKNLPLIETFPEFGPPQRWLFPHSDNHGSFLAPSVPPQGAHCGGQLFGLLLILVPPGPGYPRFTKMPSRYQPLGPPNEIYKGRPDRLFALQIPTAWAAK